MITYIGQLRESAHVKSHVLDRSQVGASSSSSSAQVFKTNSSGSTSNSKPNKPNTNPDIEPNPPIINPDQPSGSGNEETTGKVFTTTLFEVVSL